MEHMQRTKLWDKLEILFYIREMTNENEEYLPSFVNPIFIITLAFSITHIVTDNNKSL